MGLPYIDYVHGQRYIHENGAHSYIGTAFKEPDTPNVYITGDQEQELHIILDEALGVGMVFSPDACQPIVDAVDEAVGEYMDELGMPIFSGVFVTGNVLGENVTTVYEMDDQCTIIDALEAVLVAHTYAASKVFKTQNPKRH